MNEPADPDHVNLQSWYRRVEEAIRAVDPDHILFLDGNTYAMDFSAFQDVLPNCVYAIHDYATMGFPSGEPYVGSPEQKEHLRRAYERKVEFMKEKGVPVCFVFSLFFLSPHPSNLMPLSVSADPIFTFVPISSCLEMTIDNEQILLIEK